VLVVAALVSHLFGGTVSQFLADVLTGLERIPAWIITLLVVLGELLGLALVVVGGILAVVHRRWRLLGGIAIGIAVAAVLFWIVNPGSDDSAEAVTRLQEWFGDIEFEGPSSYALAGVVAITAAVTPWTSRRWRRAWWAAAFAVAAAHLIGTPVSLETLLAVLAGWVGGAASVVILGAPSRRPTQSAVTEGLRSVGTDLARLEPASVDARGSTPYFGDLRDGTPVFVKTLGADERSADLLFRMFRRLQPRDLHDERPFSSLRRTVEHEALVAVMARQSGVRTPPLLAFAPAEPNGFTLAYEAVAGHSLDREPDGDELDGLVRDVWRQVAVLRATRIAHRDLRLANVFVGEDRVVLLIDFGFSELAADDVLLDGDVAELLASTASVMGPERATAAAVDVMGSEAVRRCVHRLRPALLSGATRSSLAEQKGLLDRLVAMAGSA
jgi:tRNA A-37 threonylcarbamoyl transferase component Bud32